MKIQYTNWQAIDLKSFDEVFSSKVFDDKYLSVLNSDFNTTISSATNSKVSGRFGDYSFVVTGSHLQSDSPTLSSFNFKSSVDSFKAAFNFSYNFSNDQLTGKFTSIEYNNISLNTSFKIAGNILYSNDGVNDTFGGSISSFSFALNGNKVTFMGDLGLNGLGDLSSGTVNSFSYIDHFGYKLAVTDLSMSLSQIESFQTISDLYTYLSNDNNTIQGDTGDNILDGGLGVDILIGNKGDDGYLVDIAQSGVFTALEDSVVEKAKAGTDTITLRGSLLNAELSTLTISANVENFDASQTTTTKLNLNGNALNNVITGNDADNVLFGLAGNDTLTGGLGNDVLDGGKGKDTMQGGAGDDTYVIDVAGDIVTEATNEGVDTILSSLSLTLSANFENLTLTGKGKINAFGNELDNILTGNTGNNTLDGKAGIDHLDGGAGKDILTGGAGDDTLTGGLGADTFVWKLADKGEHNIPCIDVVTDFNITQKDVIDLRDLLDTGSKAYTSNLLNYLDITTDGTMTEIRISTTHQFDGGTYNAAFEDAHITLANVNLVGILSEETLLQNLIKSKNLLID